MRYRLLAFIPPATLITTILLVSASSFVSAVETSFVPDTSYAIQIQRYESDCDVLDRKIDEMSRLATGCDEDLQCLHSPILCPISMDDEEELTYLKLRRERSERCGSAPDLMDDALGGPYSERAACRSMFSSEDSPTNRGSVGPATFMF